MGRVRFHGCKVQAHVKSHLKKRSVSSIEAHKMCCNSCKDALDNEVMKSLLT